MWRFLLVDSAILAKKSGEKAWWQNWSLGPFRVKDEKDRLVGIVIRRRKIWGDVQGERK